MLIFLGTGAIWTRILPALRLGEIRFSIPSENLGNPYLLCKKRFSAISTSADKSFLAYPTGISMNPTGARKCHLTRGGVRRTLERDVDCDVLTSFLHVLLLFLNSFSIKRFNVIIFDRNRTKHFVIEKCSYFCIKLIK